MKRISTIVLAILLAASLSNAQTITSVENVYGGRINAIAASSITGSIDSFNVFISTESANTAFYAKAKGGVLGTAAISSFTKMPSLTAAAGVGSTIQKIAAYSSYMYFVNTDNKIYKTAFNDASYTNFRSFGADTSLNDFVINGSRMWFFFKVFSSNQDRFGYSDLDANGNTTNFVSSYSYNNVTYPAKTAMSYKLSDSILVFKEGTDPELTILANVTSGTTGFIHDALSALSSSVNWKCAAISPDGKIFIGGSDNSTKYIAYRDTTSAAWTVVNTTVPGVSGSNIAFYEGLLSNYYVYFGSAYSNAKGTAGSWLNWGNISLETHSNDGATLPLSTSLTGGILLLTTDQGLGWTKNSGSIITEIDNGIEAVQVNDFDMRSDKDFGWLASKAGVRYVRNYNTASKSWSNAMFPNGDGSPYYSAEMVGNDSNSAYVGNVRVYKTTSKGSSWTQVFTAENAPYNFPQVGSQVTSIAVSDSVNNIVMAGYKILGSQRGGVFYSTNGGSSWNQLLIYASVNGQDVDVNDIEITSDSGKVVAYIGVDYDNSVSPIIRGMYKAQWNGASWSVRAENIYSPSTSLININDIVIHSRDTILALGGFYNAVYGKEYGINFMISRPVYNTWTSYVPSVARTSGFTACAWHGDTLFYAYRDSILYSRIFFSSTGTGTPGEALYTKVDNGTEINVLYYDELLAGSSTGFKSLKGAGFTLPSKIVAFTAVSKQKETILSWRNESDEDVSQYQLQYSCDGGNFIILANISSTKLKNYSYSDNGSCSSDFRYYRLLITDKSGNIEYSNTIKIGNNIKHSVTAFPNPVNNGILQIKSTIPGIAAIQLFDITGRIRLQTKQNIQSISSLNVSNLEKGTYFLKITNDNENNSITIVIQ
jgi:hypothetical protein